MANKKQKNYRFSDYTLDKLEEMKNVTGINQTQIIESAVRYLYLEYRKGLRGHPYDSECVEESLGSIIKKLSKELDVIEIRSEVVELSSQDQL